MNNSKILFILFITILLIFLKSTIAEAALDKDFVSNLVGQFNNKAASWEGVLRGHAITLFRWLVVFEVAYLGIRVALGRDQIHEVLAQFVLLLLATGFFLAVINNYQAWAWNLIDGLQKVAGELGAPPANSQGPFQVGMDICATVLNQIDPWKPGDAVALMLCALVVLICFALITARIVVIKCEAIIAIGAALLLIGLGGASIVRNYAVNAIQYVFSVAFKLFVMQLLIGVGISFITSFSSSTAEFSDLFVVMGAVIILYVLVQNIPETCASIINGAHIGSGQGLKSAVGAGVGTGAAVLGGVGALAGGASAVFSASKLATMEGQTGEGKITSMAGQLFTARSEAQQTKSTSSEIMRQRLARARMSNYG